MRARITARAVSLPGRLSTAIAIVAIAVVFSPLSALAGAAEDTLAKPADLPTPKPVREVQFDTEKVDSLIFARWILQQSLAQPLVLRAKGGKAPIKHWNALRVPWTFDYLARSSAKKKPVLVKQGSDPKFGWGCCKLTELKLKDVVAAVQKPPSESSPAQYTYFSGAISGLSASLLGDLKPLDFVEPRLLSKEDAADVPTTVHLWLGSAGVITPLHNDLMHNFFVQVQGRKRFTLFAPDEWANVYMYPKFHLQHRNTMVDVDRPDLVRFPNFQHAQAYTVDLEPGDMLYIPPLWFHHVLTLEASIAVNVWSADDRVFGFDKAWDVNIPLHHRSWTKEKAVYLTGVYVRTLVRALFIPDDAARQRHVAQKQQQERKALKKGQPMPKRTLAQTQADADELDAEWLRAGQKFARDLVMSRFEPLKDAKDVVESLHMEVDRDSGEVQELVKYRRRVADEAPPFLEDFAKERHDDAWFHQLCSSEQNFNDWAAPFVLDSFVNSAAQVRKAFADAPLELRDIYLGYYIEDLVSQMIGEADVYRFLRFCVTRPDSGGVELASAAALHSGIPFPEHLMPSLVRKADAADNVIRFGANGAEPPKPRHPEL